MDLQSVLNQVESWSIEERVRLLDRLWEGLCDDVPEMDLSELQQAELERRLQEDDMMPDDVVSWEEVRDEALRRAAR